MAEAGEAGWVLTVGFVSTSEERTPPEGALVAGQLDAYGITPLPERTWIYRAAEAPCRARVEGYESTLVNEDLAGDRETTGYEITALARGCDAPAGTRGWAVSGPEEITATCVVVDATHRDGYPHGDEGPDNAPLEPVPPIYEALVPELRCRHRCTVEWEIDEVPTTPTVSRVKISRVDADPRADHCQWENATTFGTFVDLRQLRDAPLKRLLGAFVLDGEPRLLLFAGSGSVAVSAVEGGRLGETVLTPYDDVEIGECGSWQCCCGC